MAIPVAAAKTAAIDWHALDEASLLKHVSAFSELPERYQGLSASEVERRIEAARRTLGDSTLILVHNYQNDSVYRWADRTGDSYQLSVQARDSDAKNIIFCGVTFMAETADIVTGGTRNVLIPSMEASCPMAGMSEMLQVRAAWNKWTAHVAESRLVPVTYMNSYADLKSFTGDKGGLICTSSNSRKAYEKVWRENPDATIVFMPDKHLGGNTAKWLGVADADIVNWNPWDPDFGGTTPEALAKAKVILWEGYCQVHDRFKPEHVDAIRAAYDGIRVLVHPECRREVVDMADEQGSTAYIIDAVENSPPGSKWAIGTEVHLVKRLAKEHPDKTIVQLCGDLCLDCNAMRQVQAEYLLWCLEELVDGNVVNPVKVDDADRPGAQLALDRMLEL